MTTPTPHPTQEQVEAALDAMHGSFQIIVDALHWCAARNAKDWRRDDDTVRINATITRQEARFSAAHETALADHNEKAAEVERLRGALRFYADGKHYHVSPLSDLRTYVAEKGEVARAALSQPEAGGEG